MCQLQCKESGYSANIQFCTVVGCQFVPLYYLLFPILLPLKLMLWCLLLFLSHLCYYFYLFSLLHAVCSHLSVGNHIVSRALSWRPVAKSWQLWRASGMIEYTFATLMGYVSPLATLFRLGSEDDPCCSPLCSNNYGMGCHLKGRPMSSSEFVGKIKEIKLEKNCSKFVLLDCIFY